jgi:hypothetical protein
LPDLKLKVICPLIAPVAVGIHATSTSHELPLRVVLEQPSVVIVKPAETETLFILIFFLPEVAVSGFDALVVLTTTLPKESGPLSWRDGCLASGDDAASSDCASAGRASAPIRNNSTKVKAASDRTIDLRRI